MSVLIVLAVILVVAVVVLALVFRNSRRISINVEVRHNGDDQES